MGNTIKIDGHGLISVNNVFHTKKEGLLKVKFPRGWWAIYFNDWREDTIQKIRSGDESEEIKRYRGVEANVPVYNIYSNKRKISFALPRYSKDGENTPYLFIPSKANGGSRLSKKYYIFDVDSEFKILKMAKLMFSAKQ
mgnify:CR=1 FL=1|tara:strand:- start:208 stop:624 length:417 start_codon:yes stop_codon:yes gene_type:complete